MVTGFQNQIRNKVIGFGAHFMLLSDSDNDVIEAKPISKNQAFLLELAKDTRIAGIHPVAYKPILLQSERNERAIKTSQKKDSIITEQNVLGVLLKGVDKDYDWTFFKNALVAGTLPSINVKDKVPEVLVSRKIASDLHYVAGDTIRSFFVKSKPLLKKLKIAGIYETGLEEHDNKFLLGGLHLVQSYSDWGINCELFVEDTTLNIPGFEQEFILRLRPQGGSGNYTFDWGKGKEIYAAKSINPYKDTLIRVIIRDAMQKNNPNFVDTCHLKITVNGEKSQRNAIAQKDGYIVKRYVDPSDGDRFEVKLAENKSALFELQNGEGSSQNFVGAFEVNLKAFKDLEAVHKSLKEKIEFNPEMAEEQLKVNTIMDQENDLFTWLSFLDINVLIIITLMLLIGIINMGSALLVLILIKTNFIGILKAIGASNWMIRKVFLYQAGFLILRGMVIGNVIGLVLCLLQEHFSLIPLNPEVYYLSTVPIEVSWLNWITLNAVTFLICILALIVPSVVITRIMPSKSIKFN